MVSTPWGLVNDFRKLFMPGQHNSTFKEKESMTVDDARTASATQTFIARAFVSARIPSVSSMPVPVAQTGGRSSSGVIRKRRCHNCSRRTYNYRFEACWAKIREGEPLDVSPYDEIVG
jgi:hypothetical protein